MIFKIKNMFVSDNVKLAVRNFKTRKLRTFLTVLGISVGIGTTLFLVSLGYGLQKVLLEKIAKSDALLTLDITSANSAIVKIDQKTIEDFSHMENVFEVSPMQIISAQFKLDDTTSSTKLSAVENSFFRLGGIELLHGEKYEKNDEAKVILSTGALTSLGIEDFPQALGKSVEIVLIVPEENQGENKELLAENKMVTLSQKFIICGVVDDPSESSGFIPSGWTRNVAPDSFDEVKIKVAGRESLEAVRDSIIEKGFLVMALSDTVDETNKIFAIAQLMLALFGIVSLSVSAIGMFNTMTIALLERTREIGIMRAIGASRREILFLFLTESTLIGFLGGLGGIGLGFLGTNLANYGFNFLARVLGGQPVEMFFTPMWFILFIIILSTSIGLITGIYPSSKASRLNPLAALKF